MDTPDVLKAVDSMRCRVCGVPMTPKDRSIMCYSGNSCPRISDFDHRKWDRAIKNDRQTVRGSQ